MVVVDDVTLPAPVLELELRFTPDMVLNPEALLAAVNCPEISEKV